MKKQTTTSRKPKTSAKSAAKSSLADWRAATLERMRQLIQAADSQIVEEVKWRKPSNGMKGVPVWSRDGIICTGETYKEVVKLSFMNGAKLADPSRLFNSSLAGNARRAIDIHEGDKINEPAFKTLVRQAAALNGGGSTSEQKPAAKKPPARTPSAKKASSKASRGSL
jgi:hypothetical protein